MIYVNKPSSGVELQRLFDYPCQTNGNHRTRHRSTSLLGMSGGRPSYGKEVNRAGSGGLLRQNNWIAMNEGYRKMHHKKAKPEAARGGSKWNKPWKLGRTPTENPEGEKHSDHKRRLSSKLEIEEIKHCLDRS